MHILFLTPVIQELNMPSISASHKEVITISGLVFNKKPVNLKKVTGNNNNLVNREL